MNKTLSLYFNIDKTYMAIVQPTAKGMDLEYVNSTKSRIDLESIEDGESKEGINELGMLLIDFLSDVDKIDITIPSESVVVTQFPGSPTMSDRQLRSLVALEIKQAYPQFNPEEFASNIIPMEMRMDGKYMMLAVIIPNEIIDNCLKIVTEFNLPINNIEISQMNAQSAFLYNYPERHHEINAIIGVQNNFLDLSIVKNNKPIYYNLVSMDNKDKIGEVFEAEYDKLVGNVVEHIDGVYYFGTGLTKDIFELAVQKGREMKVNMQRLNAFRMLSTSLDDRDKEYASRTMHIYPPCIGGSFTAYHERIKLY